MNYPSIRSLQSFSKHITAIAGQFNEYALLLKVPVRINEASLLQSIDKRQKFDILDAYRNAHRTFPIIDNASLFHLTTLLRVLFVEYNGRSEGYLLKSPANRMAKTSLALQWIGPMLYLMTGEKTMLLNFSDQRHQAGVLRAMDNFHLMYGDLHIEPTAHQKERMRNLIALPKPALSLNSYRTDIVQPKLTATSAPLWSAGLSGLLETEDIDLASDLLTDVSNSGLRPLWLADRANMTHNSAKNIIRTFAPGMTWPTWDDNKPKEEKLRIISR